MYYVELDENKIPKDYAPLVLVKVIAGTLEEVIAKWPDELKDAVIKTSPAHDDEDFKGVENRNALRLINGVVVGK